MALENNEIQAQAYISILPKVENAQQIQAAHSEIRDHRDRMLTSSSSKAPFLRRLDFVILCERFSSSTNALLGGDSIVYMVHKENNLRKNIEDIRQEETCLTFTITFSSNFSVFRFRREAFSLVAFAPLIRPVKE